MPANPPRSDGSGEEILPRACDFCHAHVASTPSDRGAWICDHCIIAALAGPAAMAEIMAVHASMERAAGWAVPITDALAEWRRQQGALHNYARSPDPEVNARAS